jgi:hypothetical protein
MIAKDYDVDYVSVDGMCDPKRPEFIRYIGKAARQRDGTWRCLAIIGGDLLCSVEVKLTPDLALAPLAAFAKLW